jgi:hypothetical protein
MAKVIITGLKERKQAKDYSSVDKQHKPGVKGGPAASIERPPLTRGATVPVGQPTQPDTRTVK